jgi:hypothetical protein
VITRPCHDLPRMRGLRRESAEGATRDEVVGWHRGVDRSLDREEELCCAGLKHWMFRSRRRTT